MKNKIQLLFVLAILGLYSCQNRRVTKIIHSYNTNTTKYYHKSDTIDDDKAIVREGVPVEVEVIDYNPLSINVAVNQEAGTLYYQTNSNSTLLSFLKSDAPEKDDGKADFNAQDSFEEVVKKILSRKKTISDSIQHYKQFYNSIVALNNLIEQEKYNNKLTGSCLCDDLKNATENIKKYFFDTSHSTVTACAGTLVCTNLINGEEFIHQKALYFEDFDFNLIVLDTLEANLKLEFEKVNNVAKEQLKKDKEASKNNPVKLADLDKTFEKDEKERIAKNEKAKEEIASLRKKLNAMKIDYLATQSNNIDLAVNKYKAIGFLEFITKAGTFKAKESDDFKLSFVFENSLTSKTITRKIDLDVTKPMKIDYSAGVFVTPYLYDENFDIVNATDSGFYSVKKLDGGKTSYGAMGFINFHPIFCNPSLSIGFSIGTGLMFNDATKIVFSPTASVFLGKYQRLVLHFGGGFAQVNRVHSKYADEETFKDASYKPELKKQISSSFIYGLSWNLSRNK